MAYTQTYQLAQRARVKLQKEASQHDHNLRLLVGHANLLDSLMISLAEAEREQEQWFDEVVQGNMAAELEEDEERAKEELQQNWPEQSSEGHGWLAADYYSDSDSESDSESEVDSDEELEDAEYTHMPALTRKASQRILPSYFNHTVIGVGVSEVDDYDEDFEDEDEDGMYPLRRTSSHGSPPQLVADLSDDEDEEATPPSPPQISLPFTSAKGNERIETSSFFEDHPTPSPISSHHAPFLDGIHGPASMISTF